VISTKDVLSGCGCLRIRARRLDIVYSLWTIAGELFGVYVDHLKGGPLWTP
jgi:hypothetical protein